MGSSSLSTLSSSAARRLGPTAFQFPSPFVAASTSSRFGTAARRRVARRWSLRHLFDDVWVQGGGLGVQEGIEESPLPLEDGILVPEQHAVLVCR